LLNVLASEVNIDVKTLKKYIKKLKETDVLCFYRTYINASLLGFKRFAVFLTYTNLSEGNHKILEYLERSRNVQIIYSCFGFADLYFEVVAKDIDELFKLLKEISVNFPEKIKDYTFIPIVKHDPKEG